MNGLAEQAFGKMHVAVGRAYYEANRGRERILEIDHDHTTGKVRGLLCRSCNNGIGHLGDNPDQLRKAIAYLEGKLHLA